MTQAIAANYEIAQGLIAAKLWRVDPELGLIYGVKGEPFRRTNSWGYLQIKFRHPADYRAECAVLAHRVIWESMHGPIGETLQINHINGIKLDNRLANLEAISQSENMTHAYAIGLNYSRRQNARITPDEARTIYRRCWDGEPDNVMAAEYGLKRSAVNNIRNGWSWRKETGHQIGR